MSFSMSDTDITSESKNLNSKLKRNNSAICSTNDVSHETCLYTEIKEETDSLIDENRLLPNKGLDVEPNLQQIITYYESLLDSLKSGVCDASNEDFVQNALSESRGNEVQLCCHFVSASCIELLLLQCNNFETWMHFLQAFAEPKEKVCTCPSATHITELLLLFATQEMKKWSCMQETEGSNEKSEVIFLISWIADFGVFTKENLVYFLQDDHACHVACSIVRALGGDTGNADATKSRKFKQHKKNFNQTYSNEKIVSDKKMLFQVVWDEIPDQFTKILKKIVKAFLKIENILDYVTYSPSATVIETLLIILKKRIPKYCDKLVFFLMKNVFSQKEENGVPCAFIHKNCSFVVESLFKCAGIEMQQLLWQEHLEVCFDTLLLHPIGNHIVQRFLDTIEDKILFQVLSEKIGSKFIDLLNVSFYGILVSLANACNRLKDQQAQFIQNIMLSLECEDDEHLVPLLLQLRPHKKSTGFFINLQGSLLVQALLKFQKPIKLVKSFLLMSPHNVSLMATHRQGCHAFTAFFSSTTVGEKKKDQLLHNISEEILGLARDREGGLTLSRVWTLLSLRQRALLAGMLTTRERDLRAHPTARTLLYKFDIRTFMHDRLAWERGQKRFTPTVC